MVVVDAAVASHLPPSAAAVLETGLRTAGILRSTPNENANEDSEHKQTQWDFIKIHSWIAADAANTRATPDGARNGTTATTGSNNDNSSYNSSSTAAEVMVSSFVLHRCLLFLSLSPPPSTCTSTTTTTTTTTTATTLEKVVTDVIAAVGRIQKQQQCIDNWSIRSSLRELHQILLRDHNDHDGTTEEETATQFTTLTAGLSLTTPTNARDEILIRLQLMQAEVEMASETYRDFEQLYGTVPWKWSAVRMEPIIPGVPDVDNDDVDDDQGNQSVTSLQRQQQRILQVVWQLAMQPQSRSPPPPVDADHTPLTHRKLRVMTAATAVACVALLSDTGTTVHRTQAHKRSSATTTTTAIPPNQKDDDDANSDVTTLQEIWAAANKIWLSENGDATPGLGDDGLPWEELRTLVVALAEELLAVSAESSFSSTTTTRHHPPTTSDKKRPAPSAPTSSTACLRDWLGVETAERLLWHLPTLSRVLSRRAVEKRTKIAAPPQFYYIDAEALTLGDTADFLDGGDCSGRNSSSSNKSDTSKAVVEAAVVLAPVSEAETACATAVSAAMLADAAATVAAVHPRPVTPVMITEGMELNEWAVSISFLEVVKPSRQLITLLEERGKGITTDTTTRTWADVALPVVSKTLLRLSQEHVTEKSTRKAPVTVCTHKTADSQLGLVQVHGELTADKQLCKAVVSFYYHALESILYCEKARLASVRDGGGNKTKPWSSIVLNEVFHRALLTCCCSCVTKAIGFTQKLNPSSNMRKLQIYSILHITSSSPYEFLKVLETFLRSLSAESTARGQLGSPLIFGLPRLLLKDMRQVEVNIIDSLLWARNSAIAAESLTDKIIEWRERTTKKTGKDDVCLWPPPVLALTIREELEDAGTDETVEQPIYPGPEHDQYADFRCALHILRKLLQLAHGRIMAMCKYLKIPIEVEYPVAPQVWATFRYLVRNHIELLFDRHVDHWILCALYGVTRTVKYEPELKFAKIIESYIAVRESELGSVTCQRIVRHIKITAGNTTEDSMGNVITLYNNVFVPAMKEHLLNSQSLKSCATKLARLSQSGERKVVAAPVPGVRVVEVSTVAPISIGVRVDFGKADSSALAQANEFASLEAA